ncbi:PIN domain-containing protein [Caulobacter sp. D4A]|uniref:type II toxin-antitoxin system VapC family toxin n=1 Tax=unclassified Caulobacter TaxID=2648921 RepID=UPI000D726BBA|nr:MULTISPECIES: type II toxin-antitoxin system VapC family toxin [unclassified Caulobacter]PXA85602.1 PIN domain-containing protein [Caulobacter sp. D4A]PXA96307.1 PIN domain-containing protein [Caulobacter sp. D5]
MTTEFVMDSSAILALVFQEPGREHVAVALPGALISSVNLTEVISKMLDRGLSLEQVDDQMSDFSVVTVNFDRDLAIQAGVLRSTTRHKGLSLGDRACLALAMREGLPVMTADRAWSDLDLPVEVVLIR